MSVPDPLSLTVTAADARVCITLSHLVTVAAPGAAPVRVERKQAALLAYLHHAGSTPRGRLAGPALAASDGERCTQQPCASACRGCAGWRPGMLAETGDAVALSPDVVVDEPGEEQASLLDAYDYSDCDDFARWLHARVDGRRSDRQAVLTAAMRAAIQAGDFDAAQGRAEAMLALDPESEDPYRALMEVAYQRGDHAAGVRAWNRCRQLLLQQYGVTPSAATQALGAAILAAAAAGPAAPRAMPTPLPADTNPSRRSAGNLGFHRPILYGRETELATLSSTMQAHRLVTLIGIGGIGKTSLAPWRRHTRSECGAPVSGSWRWRP